MKTVRADLPNELKSVEIHTFSDWHIGDKYCKKEIIKKQIDEVKQKENAFAILNGDLINNATKTSVSDCYAEEMPPMEAIEYIIDLISPIKEKVLMINQGNHEARTYRTEGIDISSLVASQLGISDRYCREGGLLFIRFGKNTAESKNRKQWYSIYCTHGNGGGRKEGAKAIRLADMASIVDADIYIHSHTHLPMVMKQSFYRVSGSNSSVALCEKLFVNTDAKLDYGGYGQSFEFKPSSNSSPVIYLSGTRKEFTARL